MADRNSATTTVTSEHERLGSLEKTHACLFLAIECDRPLAGPARYPLTRIHSVQFGRGEERCASRDELRDGSRLLVTVPDRRMSSIHAELRRIGGGWELTDAGSKNGTFVNGKPISRHLLTDGDLFDMGRTLFLFRREVAVPDDVLEPDTADPSLAGIATIIPALDAEFSRVRAISKGSVTVLILGESGTGKELLASAIHRLSGRTGPFTAVNCGAVPANLMASELFGYRRGAFSGAAEDRPGLIRSAESGTVFLDEIADLPLESQVALLRLLQEGEVLPLGSNRPVKVDVRFLCATGQDLGRLVDDERFRRDLHTRIAGFTCRLPPLRDRREDLGLILAARIRHRAGDRAQAVTIAVDAARALWAYGWPGNVRELDNCVCTSLLLAHDGRISLAHLPDEIRSPAPTRPMSERGSLLTDSDVQHRNKLVQLLHAHAGNVSAIARELGKDRVQVHRWLKRFALDPRSFRR